MLGSAPFISRRIPAAYRGRYSGLREVAYMIGATAGRLFAGWRLMRFSYQHVFGMVVLVGIAVIILSVFNTYLDRRHFPDLYVRKSDMLSKGLLI